MKDTKIEWADHTFNPWIGCTKVSPACDNCYAEAWDRRFAVSGHAMHWGAGKPRKRTAPSNWAQPLKWNRDAELLGIRPRVFCASLADVFDNAVLEEWRNDLFALIAKTPHLDWLLLTKRIGNVGDMLPVQFDFDRHYPNVWIGATICNQEEADRDIPKLLAVPAAKRFLSMEPLLGPVDITPYLDAHEAGYSHGILDEFVLDAALNAYIDWVIVGGESGPNARPMNPDWVRSLRDQCHAAGVPFLFKQWGEWVPMMGHAEGVPVHGQKYTHQDGTIMGRAGKKAAGRLLDGREWNEVPMEGSAA